MKQPLKLSLFLRHKILLSVFYRYFLLTLEKIRNGHTLQTEIESVEVMLISYCTFYLRGKGIKVWLEIIV